MACKENKTNKNVKCHKGTSSQRFFYSATFRTGIMAHIYFFPCIYMLALHTLKG